MKCPRQLAFAASLEKLLGLSLDLGGDHFSFDEWEGKAMELENLKKIFINNWCPILKEYEQYDGGSIVMKPEAFVEELDKGLGNGPLRLGIFCNDCGAQFDLNRDSAALAMLMNASFLEYVRYVQNSECLACKDKNRIEL